MKIGEPHFMNVERIDRVLIAVGDLGVTSKLFSDLLGLEFGEIRVDKGQKVRYTRSAVGL